MHEEEEEYINTAGILRMKLVRASTVFHIQPINMATHPQMKNTVHQFNHFLLLVKMYSLCHSKNEMY